VAIDGRKGSIAHWYEKVRGQALTADSDGMILESGLVSLSREIRTERFKGLSGIHALQYGRRFLTTGTLSLYGDKLFFQGANSREEIFFPRISSVTIESNTVILDRIDAPTLYFNFKEEPGKKWEDCIQKAIADFFSPAQITEFCPRIRFAENTVEASGPVENKRDVRVSVRKWYKKDPRWPSVVLRWLIKSVAGIGLDIQYSGMQHIPREGAAVLAANHVSFMDGIILGACLPRLVWFMTKNSPYNHYLIRTILKFGGTFPVRRYRTDVVAVRNAFRVLQQGHLLGVFPEGERSWDGKRLPFKKGTLRLMLAAGKPVVPVGIGGAYELMPRWTASIRRVPVRINAGEPMQWEKIPIASQTEADIADAGRRLNDALEKLTHNNTSI